MLEFDARGQALKLVKQVKPRMGSKGGYLNARFQLDGEYDDAEKVIVSFGDQRGEGEMAFELGPSNEHPVPDEIAALQTFSVWLTCRTVSGAVFQTNRVRIQQRR